MTKQRTTQTDIENRITEHFLFKRFELMALNQMLYKGLPDTMQERHVETPLFNDGRALFFVDKLDGPLCLPCMEGEGVNIYGDPLRYIATGYGKRYDVAAQDAVLIENNKLRMPTRAVVMYFVKQLYEVCRTRDINVKTLKAPFIITCNDKSVLTMKKIFEEIDKNQYAIFPDKSYNVQEAVNVLQTGVKSLTGELTDLYHDILNEALTYLGINNANTDKRERLITSEANANNQFIDSCAEMFLESRRRAVEEINKKFGYNISVELRTAREEAPAADPAEGGAEDGNN